MIKIPFSGNGHCSRIKNYLENLSRTPCFIFCGTNVEQQLLFWRFIQHLPSHTKLSRVTSSKPCEHAASITESSFRTSCYWLGFFLQGPLGHSLQDALWLSPTPSQNFRGTFAKILRKYPYPQTPAISRGRIRGTASTRGLCTWLSQSLTFEGWLLHLELGPWYVQVCASRPWYLAVAKLHLRKFGCYLWRERQICGTILLPDPRAAGGGSPFISKLWCIPWWWSRISNFLESLAK